MGCDIHLYKEKQVNGKWVTADHWEEYDWGDEDKGIEVPWENRFTDRNYSLFGLLSKGVRCDLPFAFEQRGFPVNACKEVASQQDKWEGDGHSHSFLYLHELKDMRAQLDTLKINISGMKNRNELQALRESIASDNPDWNLLYPYCGWTNGQGYEEFEIDVPASFILGDSLDKIITSFDGVEGDNHRIVFFFDN